MTDTDWSPESRHGQWIEAREPEWMDVLFCSKRIEIPWGVMLSTDRGLSWFNQYANDTQVDGWRTKILPLVALVIIGALAAATALTAGATAITRPEPTALNQPQNMLIIPGINRLIPWSAGLYVVITMIIATAFHELIHAVFGLKHGCKIEQYGLIAVGPIPLGAFVEPENEAHKNLSPWPKMEVFASAPLSNLWLALVFYNIGVVFPGTPNDATIGVAYESWLQAVEAGELTTLVPVVGHPITDLCIWGAVLSLNLGLFNLLPIGPLDGGQVLRAAVEGFTSRFGIEGIDNRLSKGVSFATIALLGFALFAPFLL